MTSSQISQCISAIALAGGQSSRMGTDKALLAIDGIPLLQRVCEVARACASEVYIVAPWPERYQNLPLGDRCEFVRETDPQGPLSGFALGLSRCLKRHPLDPPDWILLLACDLPNLNAEIVRTWAQRLSELSERTLAYLPSHRQPSTSVLTGSIESLERSKQWEPLCGFYRSNCLPNLTRFIDRGGRSFQGWLAERDVEAIPDVDLQMLFNCNTPADLAIAQEFFVSS